MIDIVIPTYPPHIRYNNRYLESIVKYADSSSRDIRINFIISKYDRDVYNTKLRHTEHVNLIVISDILKKMDNIEVDENKLLVKLKKFNYQSIKNSMVPYMLLENLVQKM